MGLLDRLFSRRTRPPKFVKPAQPKPEWIMPLRATPVESEGNDLMIFSERELIKVLEEPVFSWWQIHGTKGRLEFRRAFKIVSRDRGAPLEGCCYRIHDRNFLDLSFVNGKTIHSYPEGCEIRKDSRGTRFLYAREELPVFDSGDLYWDRQVQTVVYCDREGVNLITCRHGSAIPDISVYVGMTQAYPGFADWLRELGCDDRVNIASPGNGPVGFEERQ